MCRKIRGPGSAHLAHYPGLHDRYDVARDAPEVRLLPAAAVSQRCQIFFAAAFALNSSVKHEFKLRSASAAAVSGCTGNL